MSVRARFLLVIFSVCAAPSTRAETLNVAADAQTNSKLPNLNSGGDPAITACNASTCNLQAGAVFNGYFRFDLSASPDAATVDKAVLRLWAAAVIKSGTVNVVRIAGPWDEAKITAATGGAGSPSPFATGPSWTRRTHDNTGSSPKKWPRLRRSSWSTTMTASLRRCATTS